MWITSDGVAHTVALPNWRLMLSGYLAHPSQLSQADLERLQVGVDRLEADLYSKLNLLPLDPSVEERFAEVGPPVPANVSDLLSVDVIDSLLQMIESSDMRWRLDYLLAAQDACDELIG